MKKVLSIIALLAMILSLMSAAVVIASAGTEGDANGDSSVDMKDVLVIRKFIAGMSVSITVSASDVDGDGQITMKDVLIIRKFIAGIIPSLDPSQPTQPTRPSTPITQPVQPVSRIDNRFSVYGDISLAMAYMQNVLHVQMDNLDVLRYYNLDANAIFVQYKEKNSSSYGYLWARPSEYLCSGSSDDYRYNDLVFHASRIKHDNNGSCNIDELYTETNNEWSYVYLDETEEVKALVFPDAGNYDNLKNDCKIYVFEKDSTGRTVKMVRLEQYDVPDPKSINLQYTQSEVDIEYSYNSDGTLQKYVDNNNRKKTTYSYDQNGLRVTCNITDTEDGGSFDYEYGDYDLTTLIVFKAFSLSDPTYYYQYNYFYFEYMSDIIRVTNQSV